MPVHLLEQIFNEYIVAAGLHPRWMSHLAGTRTAEARPAEAGHESQRTTQLYNQTKDEITLSEVERIRLHVRR